MGGGLNKPPHALFCVLLEKLPLEPMMKPPSKFLFFAIFSHGMFAFSQNCVFLVLIQFAPYSCGGGGSTCPHPFFGHFWLILKFFFTNHFFRQNPTTFVKDIFFQNCKKVFKITFENFHFRAIDQSINQNTKYRIFAPHF